MKEPITEQRPSADHEPSGRQRARKGEGDLLRDEILGAAEHLLEEHGSKDAVTMRSVADRVGVSVPSIYLHFEDKDILFYQCCRRNMTDMAERLKAASAGPGTVVDRLRRCGEAYLRFGLERPGQYLTLFGADIPDSIDADTAEDDPGRQCLEVVVRLIGEGVANGELRRELDPLASAIAVWAAAHGAVNLLLTKRLQDDLHEDMPSESEVIAAVVDLAISGVTP